MALFGKKKAETSCCGGLQASYESSNCCGRKVEGICCIKVLGSGCKSCHQLYDNAKKAAEGIEVEYITDLQKIMEYGVMSMPALVINDKVVSQGRTLDISQITEFIKQAAVYQED